jgi:hypothetical protein
MKLVTQIVLAVVIVVLGYLVYDSVNSRIVFEKTFAKRKSVVVDRLKDIRAAQIAYKNEFGKYTSDFDVLLDYINNGKVTIIKKIGDEEDSLAVAQGLVSRDTILIAVRDTVFNSTYIASRTSKFFLDSIPYVPFSNGVKFEMDTATIEKSRVKVPVFEVRSYYKDILRGLDADKHSVKLDQGLVVGSLTETSTNGNWE